MGNFGVIRMVAKELAGANTLSGKRRLVKLNDVTEISDFYPTKLKILTVSLTRQSKKRLNINQKMIQIVVMNQISSLTVLIKYETKEKHISN